MEFYVLFSLITLTSIVVFGVLGMINGFIKEMAGLIGIIGGVFVATRFAEQCGNFINNSIIQIQNPSSIYLVGFVAVFLLFWIFCILFGFLFSKIVKFSKLTFIDRLLGFIFGGLKVFLILAILTTAITYIGFIRESANRHLDKSFMYELFLKAGRFIISLDYSNLDIDSATMDLTSKVKNTIGDTDLLEESAESIKALISNATGIITDAIPESFDTDESSQIDGVDNNDSDDDSNLDQ
jgi:membrane protein required for colicin V production